MTNTNSMINQTKFIHHHLLEAISETATVLELTVGGFYTTPPLGGCGDGGGGGGDGGSGGGGGVGGGV